MKFIISYFFSLCITISVIAHTTFEQSFTCPIEGKKFQQVVDASGTQFGARLDFKPLGPMAAPWAIPQCPKCKFVLYDEAFEKATVQKLKPFILSDDYRLVAADNSSYFCLARIREFLGADGLKVGDAYLQASWQVESKPKKCQEYLGLAYERLSAGVKSLKPADKQIIGIVLLLGELERRLGNFDAAAKRFGELKTLEEFKDAQIQKIITRQLHLISQKDTAPHAVDDEQEKLVEEEKSRL